MGLVFADGGAWPREKFSPPGRGFGCVHPYIRAGPPRVQLTVIRQGPVAQELEMRGEGGERRRSAGRSRNRTSVHPYIRAHLGQAQQTRTRTILLPPDAGLDAYIRTSVLVHGECHVTAVGKVL